MDKYCTFHDDRWDKNFSEEERNTSINMRNDIIKKYDISEGEFDFIQVGLHLQEALDFPYKILDSPNGDELVISMPKDIKKKDYVGAWGDLVDFLRNYETVPKSNHRVRSANDTLLIYAIHKARVRGLTFSEIFKKYQKGALDPFKNDNGRINKFESVDDLAKYYRRNKPDR